MVSTTEKAPEEYQRPWTPRYRRLLAWLGAVRVNKVIGFLVQNAIALSPAVYELMLIYRSAAIDDVLPGRPAREQWFRYYRSHNEVSASVFAHELGITAKEVIGFSREVRDVVKWPQADPDSFKIWAETEFRLMVEETVRTWHKRQRVHWRMHCRELDEAIHGRFRYGSRKRAGR